MATTTATVNGYLQMANGCYLLKPNGGKIIINQTSLVTEAINLKPRDSSYTLSSRDASLTLKDRDSSYTLQPDRD